MQPSIFFNILGDWVLVIYKLVLHKKECILFYLYIYLYIGPVDVF